MELINQHTKRIMEGCKERAREAGLCFHDETLEYIVSNKDLLELGPKNMIPTLYDYWVHDVEVLREKGRYEIYPHNPYETVINTRPAISFYNDNNPDWLNVMIFYHVLAHIDFFQNNILFEQTWGEDFAGRALADKRVISRLRSEHGRWVDYVIEFSRGIDNILGYYEELREGTPQGKAGRVSRLDYYFDHFLQETVKAKTHEYLAEVDRYNACLEQYGEMGETLFFSEAVARYPEFEALFTRYTRKRKDKPKDLLQYLMAYSPFLKREENAWMKTVMEIVRATSLHLQPQIRTKILNEGWASYWHEKLFMADERIRGHEVSFARVHAGVTSLPRVGLNPYALGMRLLAHVEEQAGRGRLSWDFQRLKDQRLRQDYDRGNGQGVSFLLRVREHFSDFTFLNTFVDQDFVDRHKLFVAGKRLNREKGVWEVYVKSRNADHYRQMLLDSLYHPPHIEVDESRTGADGLYLIHRFEGKPLVEAFIANTMMGIEFLWGGPVRLETTRWVEAESQPVSLWNPYFPNLKKGPETGPPRPVRVLYTMKDRKLSQARL